MYIRERDRSEMLALVLLDKKQKRAPIAKLCCYKKMFIKFDERSQAANLTNLYRCLRTS